MFSNEVLFFIHVFAVVGLVLFARCKGKSALLSLVVLQAVFANLFVIKQISLFGLQVTCSDVFAVGGILALNLLQEEYGKKEANKALYASFLGLLFYMGMSQFHLSYQPLIGDQTQDAFSTIFSNTLRISLASISVYFIVQKIDLQLFAILQKILGEKRLPLRIGLSLTFSQMYQRGKAPSGGKVSSS